MAVVLSRRSGGGGGGGAPSGPAGGDLTGTYPNPTIDSGASGAGEVLTSDGAGGAAFAPVAGGGLFDAYAYLRDEKADTTNAGTFTGGAWRTRTLNTEVVDTAAFVSLAANQFTLGAGTYWFEARAPAFVVDFHKLRLQNITDAATALLGNNNHCSSGASSVTTAQLSGRVTIAASKAFELQHRCLSTRNNEGFGIAMSFGVTEIYAEIEIWREAA